MSTKETKSITPAENPKATVRNVVFVLSVKKAIRLPMPVERPAMRVSPKAMSMVYVSISAAICAGMGFMSVSIAKLGKMFRMGNNLFC